MKAIVFVVMLLSVVELISCDQPEAVTASLTIIDVDCTRRMITENAANISNNCPSDVIVTILSDVSYL